MKNKKTVLQLAAFSLLSIGASAQQKINRDSIYSMPAKDVYKHMREAHKRPPQIEYDTLQMNAQYLNNGIGVVSAYDRVLNKVVVHHFTTKVPELRQTCRELNSGDKQSLVAHESDHAIKDSIENIANLTLEEMLVYQFHFELSAHIAENKTASNDYNDAVSSALRKFADVQKNYSEEVFPLWLENNLVFTYFYQNEYGDEMRATKKLKKLKTFDEAVRSLYLFDGKCILDIIRPDIKEKLFKQIARYSNTYPMKELIAKLASDNAKICQSCEEFRNLYSQMLGTQR